MSSPVYILHAASSDKLSELTRPFAEHMEPMLLRLERALSEGDAPDDVPAFRDYLEVCRWRFRRLEYSFAMSVLQSQLTPGRRFLDAGSGVTPFAHAMASMGVEAFACDADKTIVNALTAMDTERIYGTSVTYAWQDLTATTYPDDWFDAIACISVIEHIPAPADQRAVHELVRILRPGGILVITVDYAPPPDRSVRDSRFAHYLRRLQSIPVTKLPTEFPRIAARKIRDRKSISGGGANHARSANQRFNRHHLDDDIIPILAGGTMLFDEGFEPGYDSATSSDARRFWDLEEALFELQGSRLVLPAAFVFQKSPYEQTTITSHETESPRSHAAFAETRAYSPAGVCIVHNDGVEHESAVQAAHTASLDVGGAAER